MFSRQLLPCLNTERYFMKLLTGLENKAAEVNAENHTSVLILSFILRRCVFLHAVVKVLPELASNSTISVL